jgi:hypothetical protein
MDILPNNPCALWRETEPFGIHLIPAADTTWALNPLARNDIPLMHITTKSYDSKGSRITNRCCHYVHIISFYDLLLYDCPTIHPSYLIRREDPSTISANLWPNNPHPPKTIGGFGGIFFEHTLPHH